MYISFFMFKSRKFLILDKSFCHNSFEPISLIDHCPANRTLNKMYRRKRTTYPSRAHLCCSPETFPSDLHKVSRHEPQVGWCMSENVLLFLHHKSHYTGPSFPTSSSLHSLEREKRYVVIMYTPEKLWIVFLPGHIISLLQSCVISFKPRQVLPPWAAGGLVHERELVWVPPPQVTLHWLQFPHDVQPPLTERSVSYCTY